MSFDLTSHGPKWEKAFKSVQELVGGRVVAVERQERWRPAFFLDVERPGGEIVPICFRGNRAENPTAEALEHEYRCFVALEKNGIPVPHIYGYCEEPAGIVMAKVAGRPDLATAKSPEEAASVRDHFIEILARIHQLPTTDFEAFGMRRRTSPRELALGDSPPKIERFLKTQTRPEPGLAFLIDWTERNIPEGRTECCFVTADSGQYIFDESRVTAVLDLEIAYLGDPLADLGGLFSRDLSESMGDLEIAMQRYETAIGAPVDRRVVLYHAIRWAMTTPLATAPVVADPPVVAEYVQYLSWHLVYQRTPLELIAHVEGIEIDPPELPSQEFLSPVAVAHDALQARFGAFASKDSFQAYEVDGLRRLALYLRQADRFGAAILELDFDDAQAVLGRRPATWQERDAALEDCVKESAGTRNAELVRYLVRRYRREEFLLEPAMREFAGVRMQTLSLD